MIDEPPTTNDEDNTSNNNHNNVKKKANAHKSAYSMNANGTLGTCAAVYLSMTTELNVVGFKIPVKVTKIGIWNLSCHLWDVLCVLF